MNFRASVAKVEVVPALGATPTSRGTGALVSERLVLTALHVVAKRVTGPPETSDERHRAPLVRLAGSIQLTFHDGEVVEASPVDGCWHHDDDWALLECDRPVRLPPLPLGEFGAGDVPCVWSAFGYPDAKPDGIIVSGRVDDTQASYHGRAALQLFCDQAAAGEGLHVRGLSGAPCVVEGALVGVLRSSLVTSDARNVGGTLFATPLGAILERASDRLPSPDPLRGLPGLPRADLPDKPFRYLAPYTRADAEIFFGRSSEIRRLYKAVVADDDSAVLVFYGTSGVGKSSLLEAGLYPRLSASHSLQIKRRDAEHSLRDCLDAALGSPPLAAVSGDRRARWLALEAECGRPLVVVIDQVEEAFTQPCGDPEQELAELCQALSNIFREREGRPRGRALLSLRKEWLAEVESKLADSRLHIARHHVTKLDREGIVDVVHGVERTARLKQKYKVSVENGLGITIANDLLSDLLSPAAPMLQILMTRLYGLVQQSAGDERLFTTELYLALRHDGLYLEDFVERQLKALPKSLHSHLDSGLIDDLLEAHTTTSSTAATLTRVDLEARYAHCKNEAVRIVDALKKAECALLTGPSDDLPPTMMPPPKGQETLKGATRLVHDTLAPIVRRRFLSSERPGQRARRLLELRAGTREQGAEGDLLSPRELEIVGVGAHGMRQLGDREQKLFEESRAEEERRLQRQFEAECSSSRLRWFLIAVAALGALMLVALLWQQLNDWKDRTAEFRAAVIAARTHSDPLLAKLATERLAKHNQGPLRIGANFIFEEHTRLPHALALHDDIVVSLGFLPNGELVTATREGVLSRWSADGKRLAARQLGIGEIAGFELEGLGRVAIVGDHGIKVVDPGPLEAMSEYELRGVIQAVFVEGDSNKLAVLTSSDVVHLIDLSTPNASLVHKLNTDSEASDNARDMPNAMASKNDWLSYSFSRKEHLAVTTSHNAVRVWDVLAGTIRWQRRHSELVGDSTPQKGYADSASMLVKRQSEERDPGGSWATAYRPLYVALSPDGEKLLVQWRHGADLWWLGSGQRRALYRKDNWLPLASSVAFNAESTRLVIGAFQYGATSYDLSDPASASVLGDLPIEASLSLQFSPDGTQLLVTAPGERAGIVPAPKVGGFLAWLVGSDVESFAAPWGRLPNVGSVAREYSRPRAAWSKHGDLVATAYQNAVRIWHASPTRHTENAKRPARYDHQYFTDRLRSETTVCLPPMPLHIASKLGEKPSRMFYGTCEEQYKDYAECERMYAREPAKSLCETQAH